MKLLWILILFIYVASCTFNDVTYVPSAKERLANKISRNVANQLKREKNLIPFGSGGGTMDHVRMLALSFQYHREINIDEARSLLMAAGTLFLNSINENEEIRPYLKNYPFEPKNIQIRIFLQLPDGSKFGDGTLRVVSMIDGNLKYKIMDQEIEQFVTILHETFEEAKSKMNSATNQL